MQSAVGLRWIRRSFTALSKAQWNEVDAVDGGDAEAVTALFVRPYSAMFSQLLVWLLKVSGGEFGQL